MVAGDNVSSGWWSPAASARAGAPFKRGRDTGARLPSGRRNRKGRRPRGICILDARCQRLDGGVEWKEKRAVDPVGIGRDGGRRSEIERKWRRRRKGMEEAAVGR